MKKTSTIVIASLFAATALFASDVTEQFPRFGYSVDVESHSNLDLEKPQGYNLNREVFGALDLEKPQGYNLNQEVFGALDLEKPQGYNLNQEVFG